MLRQFGIGRVMSNMKELSAKSSALYACMLRKGYPKEFAALIASELNTDFTAKMMLGYLSHSETYIPMESVADEMFSILSLRESIVSRKKKEYYQHTINELCRYGLDTDDE